jgi:hypothetical protein
MGCQSGKVESTKCQLSAQLSPSDSGAKPAPKELPVLLASRRSKEAPGGKAKVPSSTPASPVHSVRRDLKCDREASDGAAAKKGEAKGRRYCSLRASHRGGIHVDDLLLGVELASLAYTDNNPGTINNALGAREALEMLFGRENVDRPLTDLLGLRGFEADRIFSHTRLLGDLQAVDTQGFIAHSQDDIALVYRGTTGAMDWLTNLRSTKVPFQPCVEQNGNAGLFRSCAKQCATAPEELEHGLVHHGFYDAMLASRVDIDEVLLPQLRDFNRPKRLIVCGHSLGGAIATAAFGYLFQKFDFASSPHVLLFVTAGQPRFGDRQFNHWLNSEVQRLRFLDSGKCSALRIVDDYDIVPTVPPRAFGMKHVGKLCLVTHRGELLIGPDAEESEKIQRIADYVNDHLPSKYLARLRALGQTSELNE